MSDETNMNPNSEDVYRPAGSASIEMPAHQRDAMISRVVDGCASGEDWDTFRAIAADDQTIWSELAIAQRQYESLSEIMHHTSAIADSVELPGGAVRQGHHQNRLDFVSRWGGWAAAVAIMLVWIAGMPALEGGSMGSGGMTAGLGSNGIKALTAATPEEAMDQYMTAGYQAGRVVGEVPNPIVIETRPMSDGSFEVLYIRQILERKVLSEVYRETNDEFGNSIAVPIETDPKRIKSF